jgi:hypothetical protein
LQNLSQAGESILRGKKEGFRVKVSVMNRNVTAPSPLGEGWGEVFAPKKGSPAEGVTKLMISATDRN